ncbi:glycoside hydrolase family 79 protein [Stereum hirsutum FP-91666 SS1]|uniref:Glycoside hydrolase family 79 protein n=1 Tax=Stereum hirsutum (strain FP-91666) TaxID=721885 RepID=R7RYA5_STEHR|nr:glycoside hydrolase family 79 protein [Stereum hirsutum FP-91666 SS1]EIM80386.1 glycoside hydrolase family 79 protein [Stereum hirsutum FP-91666 SS1]
MLFFFVLAAFISLSDAQFSVYRPKNADQVIFDGKSVTYTTSRTTTATATGPAATFTNAAAYNQDTLQAPALPVPAPATEFSIQLVDGGMTGLSIKQNGAFYGFSVEMSVAENVLGRNSSLLQVPFLNLMANIQERVGSVLVRVGGNTQEQAAMVSSLPNSTSVSMSTGSLQWTPDLLYTMANISALTNTRWLLGIPWFQASPFVLDIVHQGEQILGDKVIGYQAANEPDLYARHGNRPSTYTAQDYVNEVGALVDQISTDSAIPMKNNLLVAPSLAGNWNLSAIWNTSFISTYSDSLALLSVEHYPESACDTVTIPVVPQDAFAQYLTHSFSQQQVAKYLPSTALAQQSDKQFLMSETNSGSCGGWAGLSDSFGAALWALDYGLTMAYSNFTGALLHVGGLNSFYNPFFSPPTNQSHYRQWTVGPVYYSALIMAEILGPSNASQVVDLQANANSDYTPGYAIFENGSPTKVALFNLMTDPSGNSDYTATLSISGATLPSQVTVKYLRSSSVSDKAGYTWANQSFGDALQADGRLQGTLDVQTVQCDQTSNTCAIKVPAPSFALVFLTDDAESEATPSETLTFSTSTIATATAAYVDPSVLATSNGQSGLGLDGEYKGSTSPGSVDHFNSAGHAVPWMTGLIISVLSGLLVVLRTI